MDLSLYDILRVEKTATQKQLAEARRTQLLKLNCNASSSDSPDYERFQAIIVSYNILSNPAERQRYDLFGCCVDAHEIIDGLWLGDQVASQNSKFIEGIGITHVLTVLQLQHTVPVVNQFQIFADDIESSSLIDYFDQCFTFIEQAISDQGKVLVHCAAGVSRSPTIVTAYLMKKRNIGYEEALTIVRQKRRVVNPHSGFLEQLKIYQQQLILPLST